MGGPVLLCLLVLLLAVVLSLPLELNIFMHFWPRMTFGLFGCGLSLQHCILKLLSFSFNLRKDID